MAAIVMTVLTLLGLSGTVAVLFHRVATLEKRMDGAVATLDQHHMFVKDIGALADKIKTLDEVITRTQASLTGIHESTQTSLASIRESTQASLATIRESTATLRVHIQWLSQTLASGGMDIPQVDPEGD